MFGCDRVFYYPNRVRYGSPEELNLRYESVRLPTSEGLSLHGYWFPAALDSIRTPPAPSCKGGEKNGAFDSVQTPPAPPCKGGDETRRVRGTVLHLHGNAGNITGHFQHVAWLPAAGWNVLTFDYRGYGKSEGKVTRAGTLADANAALDYLLHRPDVDSKRIVLFGQSLGGALGIVLTAERPEILALATDGAFDSYRRIVGWHIRRNPLLLAVAWWFPLAMQHGYDPIDYVGKISPRPLFIMHGTADHVVDPAMARRLYAAASEPKELWLVPGADHYGAMQDEADEAHARLLSFFNRSLELRKDE